MPTKNTASLEPEEAWAIAKRIVQLAYVYQRQIEEPTMTTDCHLASTFDKINSTLTSHEKSLSKDSRPLFDFWGINQLTTVFQQFMNDEIDKEQARISSWKTLVGPDEDGIYEKPDAKFVFPTKEQITAYGGPQQAAITIWADDKGRGSHGTYYSIKRKRNEGKIATPTLQGFSTLFFRERRLFFSTVYEKIFGVKND